LSRKFSEALRLPIPTGVNFTLIVQVPLAAIVVPVQASAVGAKSLKLVPPIVTAEIVRAPVPLLVTISVWGGLVSLTAYVEKIKAGDDKLTAGAAPVPLRLTVCVLPSAPSLLSVRVNTPDRAPAAVGEKVTMTVQLDAALIVLPQVFACVKSPVATTLLIARAALLLLLTMTALGVLEVPIA
jgi:hypothetical protein